MPVRKARRSSIPETGSHMLCKKGKRLDRSRLSIQSRPGPWRVSTGSIRTLSCKLVRASGDEVEAFLNSVARDGEPGASPDKLTHMVQPGETVFSIARQYDVSAQSIANRNELGSDYAVRPGQQLEIPAASEVEEAQELQAALDSGETPPPQSASEQLPEDISEPETPASPDFSQYRSSESETQFLMPVRGIIIRNFEPGPNGFEGIDIAAPEGAEVVAAGDGRVVLVSRSTDGTAILLILHEDNIYSVYANLKDIQIEENDSVRRGQPIGSIAGGGKDHLHFEIRIGTEATDPLPYIS